MPHALLPQRGLLKLSGEDAETFLQGLVSNDVTRVKNGAVYAALLTPQGKFQHDFFLLPWEGGILIDIDRAQMQELHQRLLIYKLRSRVTIEAMEQLAVAAAWDETAPPPIPGVVAFADPRLPQLGWRLVGDAAHLRTVPVDAGDYDRMRLALAVPDGARDMIPGKSLLLEFGFDQLHGVDFAKGCYVGQEVTARTKYRGTLRRFVYRLRGDAALPAAGTPVQAGEMLVGEVRSSAGNAGLALLRIDEVEKAQREHLPLRCDGVAVAAELPPWVSQAPKALSVEE